ncbi:MAG: PEP/pyruvate-binding domain-containing protein, partial [Desulfuromonadales bacterium]|nr:PEP/pyruvate-binding domain-containing protein [Desulfuromonadales bacterium]
MSETRITCGISSLDELIQGLRLGDNVVWQVDHWEAYRYFAAPFIQEALRAHRRCIYLRFAAHPPILSPQPGLEIIEIDPQSGFDAFSVEVHQIIESRGREAFYVFDSLSSLVGEWATDELLANFFQITCPFLYEMDTVAYFHLMRGQHAHQAVARIRDTTQVLIEVYQTRDNLYIHPLKVLDRYSPQMFLPHLLSGETWIPVYQSGDAADLSVKAHKKPLFGTAKSTAPWEAVYHRLMQHLEMGSTSPEAISEIGELKQELSRMILGAHPEFNRLADTYLSLDELLNIRERMIGSGRIGGKAAGMLLARSILEKSSGEIDFCQISEAHDSFYVGSDVFFTFLVNNDLFKARMHYSRDLHISPAEFEELEMKFLSGKFPGDIMAQFQDMLEYFGQAPIIVRSSSLLEDSFGNAFAGKYRSEFCANQGTPEDRMKAFLQAIKLVYASALNPDALAY